MKNNERTAKRKQKRRLPQGLLALGLIGVAGTGIAWSILPDFSPWVTTSVQIQGEPGDADVVRADLYSEVMRVRRDAMLTNQDLAALELDQADAEAVLSRLLEWVGTNEVALRRSRNAVTAAERALAEQERLLRTGEGGSRILEDLEAARTAVGAAETAYRAGCAQGVGYALADAPGRPAERWARAAEHRDLPVELRYLSSMNMQRAKELLSGMADGRPLPLGVLTAFEQSGADQVREAVASHARGVSAAEAVVLPVPTELREAGLIVAQTE